MEMQTDRHDAWHPGINSRIPARLMPLVTLFRPENADVGYDEARELSDFSGLPPAEFVSFRPERLAQHEILIRVTADLSVPDGPSYEELGINLRDMVKTIFDHYIEPDMAIVQRAHDDMRAKALRIIDRELASKLFERSPTPKPARPGGTGFLTRLFGRQPQDPERKTPPDHPETAVADLWQRQLAVTEDALEAACLESLMRIVGGIIGHRGRIIPDRELLARLVANHVCSNYGGEVIAEAIRPLVDRAIAERNYRVLPVQQKPTVMNVKGASASGKSTVRPRQRRLAEKLGIPWEDFALISPDYWRKYLLDYETLGEDYKYAVIYAIVNTNPTAAIEGSLRAQALDAQSGSAMAIRGYRRSDETTASLQGDLVAEKDVLYVSAAGVVIGSTVDRLPALFQIVLATGTAGDVDVYVELHR